MAVDSTRSFLELCQLRFLGDNEFYVHFSAFVFRRGWKKPRHKPQGASIEHLLIPSSFSIRRAGMNDGRSNRRERSKKWDKRTSN
jgi:hypothetical protein